MNTITIVLLALNGAVAAIGMAEGFIVNPTVLKIFDDVRQALQFAIGALQPHLAQAQAKAKEDAEADPVVAVEAEPQAEPQE